MITFKQIAQIEEAARASTDGALQWGQITADKAAALPAKTAAEDGTSPDQVWCTWTGPTDDALILAVTGNGKTSERNAFFFACARSAVLALLEDRRVLLDAVIEMRERQRARDAFGTRVAELTLPALYAEREVDRLLAEIDAPEPKQGGL